MTPAALRKLERELVGFGFAWDRKATQQRRMPKWSDVPKAKKYPKRGA